MTHKLKWVDYADAGEFPEALCKLIASEKNLAVQWKKVTCKRCLKLRPKP